MPQTVLLPVFAARVLGGGPHTLGLLSAATGFGALAGALYLASRPSVLGLGRVIVAADVVLGLGLAGFSRSGSVWLSAALLVATGAGMMVQMAASNTLIQTMVEEDKRGRVMGFYGMAFQGVAPFGSLLGGWLAGAIGVRNVAVPGVGIRCARRRAGVRHAVAPAAPPRPSGLRSPGHFIPGVTEEMAAATDVPPGLGRDGLIRSQRSSQSSHTSSGQSLALRDPATPSFPQARRLRACLITVPLAQVSPTIPLTSIR